jgi:hypothetical protein
MPFLIKEKRRSKFMVSMDSERRKKKAVGMSTRVKKNEMPKPKDSTPFMPKESNEMA